MENRPPLAPKPDALKDQPPSVPPPPSSSAAPVPRPRKKPSGPPPAKPMPYRKHVELKDKEVSTFKSENPLAPPRVRQRPPLLARPSPPSHRLSTPGEPSEFFKPKNENNKAPVNYAVPVVPKARPRPPLPPSIDVRPRLDTPMTPPDPNDVIAASGPMQGNGLVPTTSGGNVNGVAGVVNGISRGPSSGANESEMYAEAYAEVGEEENDEAYAVVSPTRKPILISSIATKPPPPSKSTSALPPLTNSVPLPAHRTKSPTPPRELHRQHSPSPAHATPTSLDDHEYNVTSHVKEAVKKRSLGAPPIPPPPCAESDMSVDNHEYNITSHVKEAVKKRSLGAPPIPPPPSTDTRPPPKPSRVQKPQPTESSSMATDEYSVLDRPEKKPKPLPPPAKNSDEYSIINSVETSRGDHVTSQSGHVTPDIGQGSEEYGHLDLQASSENSADLAVYEEVRSEAPTNYNSNEQESATPPVQPPMEKHPRALARKASDKFKSEGLEATVLASRDRSKLPAYRHKDEARGGEVGVSKLPPRDRPPPPIPHPKRQRIVSLEKNDDTIASNESESGRESGCVSDVPTSVLEQAGYETVNTFAQQESSEMETDEKVEQALTPKPLPPNRKKMATAAPSPTARGKGAKPPPLPKPKQLPATPPTTSKMSSLSSEASVKSEATLASQNMGYEPVMVVDMSDAVEETVDGSHDMSEEPLQRSNDASEDTLQGSHDLREELPRPSSGVGFDLGIDDILQVGNAVLNDVRSDHDTLPCDQAGLDNATGGRQDTAGADNSPAEEQEEVAQGERRKSSRSSGYENQAIIDSVERGGRIEATCSDEGGATGEARGVNRFDGNVSQLVSNGDDDRMEVCASEEGVAVDCIDRHGNEDDETACTVLSPSELFTVPQHAVPGRFDYCEIDVDSLDTTQPAEFVQNSTDADQETSETFTVPPHSYPDPQGYCDIEIKETPPTSHSPNTQRISVVSTNSSSRMSTSSANSSAIAGVGGATDDIITDARGYCDIDIQPPPPRHRSPSPQHWGDDSVPPQPDGKNLPPSGNVVTDALGYCDIDIKSPPTSSHEYESVPETVTKRKSPGKAPPPPSGRPRKSQDNTSPNDSNTKANDKTTPTSKAPPSKRAPPRRRAPPPPPIKAKTVEDSCEKSPDSSPLKKELVISTGLATMPRSSPRKQPPKRPPPFAGSTSPLLSKKQMSPSIGKKLDLMASPLPSSSPLSSPAAPSASPKGWDAGESSQSSGLKKKFKGLFKQKQSSNSSSSSGKGGGDGGGSGAASSTSSGGFQRRSSWRRKKSNKLLSDSGGGGRGGEMADLSPKTKAKSLPGHTRQACYDSSQPLQYQVSYDADQEEDDDIYSTIKEDKVKPKIAAAAPSSTTMAAALAVVPVSRGEDEDREEEDESGYNVVEKKPRSISVSVSKKKKKSGKKGLDMRKASSVEHLYESADFDSTVAAAGVSKSVDNSPQVPRRPLENGDHAPVPLASPALPFPNRNVLPGPPSLDDLKEGIDSSQLYAQVVAPPTQRKSDDLSEEKDIDPSVVVMVDETGETGKAGDEKPVSTSLAAGAPEVGKDSLAVAPLGDKLSDSSPEHKEIEHVMEGEDAYAVVPAKVKKEARKRKMMKEKKEESVKEDPPDENGGNDKAGTTTKSGGKVPPPKPPKSYREHIASSNSTTQVPPEVEVKGSVENGVESENPSNLPTSDSLGNLSPLFPSLEFSFGLTPQERTRAASFSSGPPSFPPPPPPKSVSPEPISEHLDTASREGMYSTVDETKKAKRKAPPPPNVKRPPPPRARAQNGTLAEDELGYEVVKSDKKTPGRKKDPPGSQKSKPEGLVQIEKVNKPHLSPSQRSPHVYTTLEDVQNENGEVRTKEGSVTMPVRTPAAGYATVAQGKRGSLPAQVGKGSRSPSMLGKLAKHPKLSPKTRPPPPPPGQRRQGGDQASPSVAAATVDPAAEDQIGKKIFVSMENSPTPESAGGGGGAEPKFLFSHAQKFIVVGDTDNSPPISNVYEDESDGDLLDSTDWETSSGEEDAEEERAHSPEPKEPRPKTFYIAREILTTERTFVKGLTLIDKDFRQAMRSANNAHEKPVITEEGLKVILGNVSSLLSLNSGLLQELEERMAEWSTNPCIGDILLRRAPYLKLYTEYISRFDKALKTLEEFTKKSPVFAQVLREFESQPKCANLPLAGYMLDIVQRITRYKLLLSDYVKHLPDESPDKDPSQKALVIISSVATHVNETVRQMDNFRKVCDVRKKLIGDSGDTLITPHRKLLKEGELMKFSRKEKQPRMFFLFNDILIYASSIPPANTTYKVIKRIPLEGMRVEHLDDPEMRYGFQIISTCKSFRLEASNREHLHQWMTAFESAISDRKKTAEQTVEETDSSVHLGNLAPPWLPDSAVSMCQLCSAHFTVTRRRHHCRACGKIFCSECSCYLAPLKYKNNKLGRVCQICYEKLPKSEDTVSTKRTSLQRGSKSRVSLPSVLKEVKARDQSAQVSGYLLTRNAKSRKWKKRWFVVFNLVLYEFERHEDVSAKRSITLPSYQVVKHDSDPLVFVLDHQGTGKEYFKEDSPEQLERWIEVLQKAVLGEIAEEDEPSEGTTKCDLAEVEEEEEDEEETADESSPSHQALPIDTPSDTPSDATQSPSKESSQEQSQLTIEDDVTSSS